MPNREVRKCYYLFLFSIMRTDTIIVGPVSCIHGSTSRVTENLQSHKGPKNIQEHVCEGPKANGAEGDRVREGRVNASRQGGCI